MFLEPEDPLLAVPCDEEEGQCRRDHCSEKAA